MSSSKKVHGEGNYEATRQYNASTKEFLQSGRAERAARDAAPHSAKEAAEMKQAEKVGLSRRRDAGPGQDADETTTAGTSDGSTNAPTGGERRRTT